VEVNDIHTLPVILYDNLQRESHKALHFSHTTAAAMQADQYWLLHRSDCRNTLIYAHTASRNLPTCDIGLGPLTLPALQEGEFLELILLYVTVTRKMTV